MRARAPMRVRYAELFEFIDPLCRELQNFISYACINRPVSRGKRVRD